MVVGAGRGPLVRASLQVVLMQLHADHKETLKLILLNL